MYYVYIYYHPDTGVPFYVGKGSGERYKKHLTNARNPHLRNKINKLRREGYEPAIEIVFRTENEDLAYDIEEFMITQYKRSCDGGTLCNQDLGTRGSKVHDFDEEFYEMLGKVSDGELGRRYKCSHSLVSYYRRGLGIPPAPRHDVWSPLYSNLSDEDTLKVKSKLGKVKDKVIAEEFGLLLHTVRTMRKSLSIPAYSGKPLYVFENGDRRVKMSRARFGKFFNLTKQQVRRLVDGAVSETECGWSYVGRTMTGGV